MKNEIVTHFKILGPLGSGGMGEVYKAIDLNLNRTVALKFLPPNYNNDPDLRKRLVNEAQAASALDHINICSIYGIEETSDGQLFVVMSYYEGESLYKKLLNKAFDFNEAINIIIQIAEGLFKAHEKGIIHRDIKTENIFLTNDGIVKILDFGLAKGTNQTQITKLYSTPGTISYMSPEQIKGDELNNQTDIWSLGIVFYELLTGERPFKGDSDPAIIYSILNEKPRELKFYYNKTSNGLQKIIDKLLCKDKSSRYEKLSDFIIELENCLGKKTNFRKKISYKKATIKRLSITLIGITLISIVYLLNRDFVGTSIPSSDKIPIAVISFENQTGDTSFNYLQNVIPNLLITDLEQTNYFDITSWERLYDLAKQLGKSGTTYIGKNLGFELCNKDKIDLILLGSFTKAGNQFITDVKVLRTEDKKMVTSLITKGNGLESILLTQVDEITKEISSNLGLLKFGDIENLESVSDLTTNSIEAYNYFLRGREEFYNLNWEKSKNLFVKAIKIDSLFAIAYSDLAISYSYLHNDKEMNLAIEKAMNLSTRVSKKEKSIIEAQYAILAESNLKKFVDVYENLANQFPKEKWFHICLGFGYTKEGRIQDAIREKKIVLQLDPDEPNTLNSLGYDYIKLQDYETAFKYLNKLKEVSPGNPNPLDSLGDLFFLSGDLDKAYSYYIRAYELSKEFGAQTKLAYLFALKQNFKESIRWIDKRIISATSDGDKSIAYIWRGFINFLISDKKQSLKDFKEAESFAKKVNSDIILGNLNYILAWLELEMNKPKSGQSYIDKFINWRRSVTKELPPTIRLEHTIYRYWVSLLSKSQSIPEISNEIINGLKNEIAGPDSIRLTNLFNLYNSTYYYSKQNFNKAIKFKRITYLPELDPNFKLIKYNLPTQVDIAAKCYEAMGENDKAIKEYEAIIKFIPGQKERRIPNPVYHYRLGKLYEEKGLLDKAINEYQIFISIYKNFESSAPDLGDARNRLKILNKSKNRGNYGQL